MSTEKHFFFGRSFDIFGINREELELFQKSL